jgi:hypothetical protein
MLKNSAFNAQGSRVTIVVSCTGRSSENICSSTDELRKKERKDETQFTIKIGGKFSLHPSYLAV